jgi:hypothetical protein
MRAHLCTLLLTAVKCCGVDVRLIASSQLLKIFCGPARAQFSIVYKSPAGTPTSRADLKVASLSRAHNVDTTRLRLPHPPCIFSRPL